MLRVDRCPLIALLALALAAAPAAAEEPEEAEAQARAEEPADPTYIFGTALEVTDELPWIPSSNTVAAKLPLPLRETPASVAVVPAGLLAEQGATILGDALENVSGLGVHTGSGVFDFFVVRGFDSVSSGLILSDGAPELETTFYQLYNVERAEVFKGPTSFLYGGGPLGGTVNLVRKQPLPGRFGRVTAGAGSFGVREATADANLGNAEGDLSFRINGLWRETDGHRDGRDGELTAVNPALTWRPRPNHSLNINLERVEADYSPDNGLPLLFDARGQATIVPGVRRETSYQSPFDVSDQTIDRLQLDYEAIVSPRLVVRDKAYRRTMDWLSRASVFNGVFPVPLAGQLVSRSLLLLDDEQTLTGNQVEAMFSIGDGFIRHELLAGFEAVRYRDRFGFDVALLPLIPLESSGAVPAGAAGSIGDLPRVPGQAMAADAESTVLAPYAVDQISIGDSLRLLVGARYDRIDFDDSVAGTSRDDGELSPMLGAVWAPAGDLSLYANYGQAFSPPSTFTPAPDRVPEDSAQAEAGVKAGLWGGRAEASLAAFRIDREGVAIPDATGVTRQIGDQRSRGLEAELRGTLERGPGWLSGLRYLFAYAYTESELTEYRENVFLQQPPFVVVRDFSGNDAPFTPEHTASLWLSAPLPHGLGVGAGARWVSEQFIDEDNVFAIDGYTTLAAAAWWGRGPWKLRLNLDNLTDQEYFTRGFGGASVIPAPGRSATARIEVGLR